MSILRDEEEFEDYGIELTPKTKEWLSEKLRKAGIEKAEFEVTKTPEISIDISGEAPVIRVGASILGGRQARRLPYMLLHEFGHFATRDVPPFEAPPRGCEDLLVNWYKSDIEAELWAREKLTPSYLARLVSTAEREFSLDRLDALGELAIVVSRDYPRYISNFIKIEGVPREWWSKR